MVLLNHFTHHSLRIVLSLLPKCKNQIINPIKPNVLKKSAHPKNFSTIQDPGNIHFDVCVSLLQKMTDLNEFKTGKSLHSICMKMGFDQDTFLANNLIKFYAKCGYLDNARCVFDEMLDPSLVSWTSMISCYVNDGQCRIGLVMFSVMCRSGFRPNEFGYSVALKACRISRDFVMGELIHGHILKCGFELDNHCNSNILGMYVESGDICTARKFFDGISVCERSVPLWNTLIECYLQASDAKEAFCLYNQMLHSKISPTCFTYTMLIKVCAVVVNVDLGKSFHGQTIKAGVENDVIVGGALVDTYIKLGFLDNACKVFQLLEEKDNMVWCALLAGFHRTGYAEQGLNLYLKFLSEGNKPDPFTYASVFSLCSNLNTGIVGDQVHCSFIKHGFLMDSFLGSVLIEMYSKDGMISYAYNCFHEVGNKEAICFGAIINNLVSYSYDEKAFELFNEMRKLGVDPSDLTVSDIIRACGNLFMLKEGRSLHSLILKDFGNHDLNLCIGNALIEMYIKCGLVDEANLVFEKMKDKNEFSWTSMISGNNETERYDEALRLFHDMLLINYFKPSQYTVVAVIQACAKLKSLYGGKQIFGYVIKVGFESHSFVGSALINMYASNKHEIQDVRLIFSAIKEKDFVSWGSIIAAWSQNGHEQESLFYFSEFQKEPIYVLDDSIMSSSLSACAGQAELMMGKCFHSCTVKTGFNSHTHVTSSIINMYSKCGVIEHAQKMFSEIREHNLVCCTAMISGYAYNGIGEKAMELFSKMRLYGIKPDEVTFVGILTACSHAGLVNEGWKCFESIKNDYGLEPTIHHYSCMVDLLGRSEMVDEAEMLINKAPFKSKCYLLKTLLGACNKYGNVEVAKRISKMLVELEPNENSTYVLLSNIHASSLMWDTSEEIRNRMKADNANKLPGYSWVQMAG